ncbi:lytic transglycosylase domain-containing protein [Bradyrhizobium sp. DASA03068]|uniref:lytic transglycosylase domain-containing protein n=1 Tax=Bradyrhizobium sp. BLXBL-01 TaxID=3395915 RepID=UPI003F6E9995
MIVCIRRVLLAIPLFDRLRDQSSASTDVCKAGASPTACLARLGTRVCAVVPLILLLTVGGSAALAQSESAAQPAISQTAHSFAGFINEASQRFAIAPNWIRSILSVESAGDVHARSPKSAMGLMQIMPATWAELRERYNLGNDPYDPHDNILAGTAYLRELLDRYGSPGVFAAYNAGPSRYEEHLAGGSLPDETRAYVAKLANLLAIELPPGWTSSRQSSAAATLFVTRSDLMKTRDRLPVLMLSSGVTTAISAPDVSRLVARPIGVFVHRSDSGESR